MKAQDLKNSILQLAIQGKLVAQDEHDEPAEVLYAKIQAEKQKLIKEGKIKKDKPLPPITEDEIPFSIPPTWKWVRLSNLGLINPRNNIPDEMEVSFIPMSCLYSEMNKSPNTNDKRLWKDLKKSYTHVAENDIALAKITPCFENGKSAIMTNLINGFGGATTEIHVFRSLGYLNLKYILLYLKSPTFMEYATKHMTGTAGQKRVPTEVFANYYFPLPPLEEQKRIVAKIEELKPLINQYDQAEQELSTLNDKFPEQLKKSILQLAIQGKLVPQDENDEPAEVLYTKIQAEKQKLIKEGKIKKDKTLPPITEDEIPFPIPPSWKWVRLGEIVKYIQRGKSPEYTDIKKVPVISQKCNQWNGLDISSVKFITERSLYNYNQERYLLTNDLLLNSTGTGTVGRVGIYYENLNPYHIAVADSHVTVVRPLWVSSKYLYNFFASPYIQLNIENLCDGSTNQIELALQTVKKILIPLPPLEEQHRIVAKVEELLQQCNKMNQLSV